MLIYSTCMVVVINAAAMAYAFAASFQYSSLPDYLGAKRPESVILNPAVFPEYFTTAAKHRSELLEWLTYKETLGLA